MKIGSHLFQEVRTRIWSERDETRTGVLLIFHVVASTDDLGRDPHSKMGLVLVHVVDIDAAAGGASERVSGRYRKVERCDSISRYLTRRFAPGCRR